MTAKIGKMQGMTGAYGTGGIAWDWLLSLWSWCKVNTWGPFVKDLGRISRQWQWCVTPSVAPFSSGLHETAQVVYLQSQTWGLGRLLGAGKDWNEPWRPRRVGLHYGCVAGERDALGHSTAWVKARCKHHQNSLINQQGRVSELLLASLFFGGSWKV